VLGRDGHSLPTDACRVMPDLTDEPTIPVGPIPSGFGVGEESGPADPAIRRAPGEHRRDDDGAGGDRRWPWLAALGVLAVFGALGLGWLVSSIPRPSSFGGPSPTPPSVRLSTPGGSGSMNGEPPSTATAATAATPATSATPTATAATTPTPAPSTSPTASPTRNTTSEPKPPPGPILVTVPDVVGRREPSAIAQLRDAGFSVAVVHVTAESRRGTNRVVAQSPAGGEQLLKGSTVTIQVGDTA
jgi:cytoskeletal protein RodZ